MAIARKVEVPGCDVERSVYCKPQFVFTVHLLEDCGCGCGTIALCWDEVVTVVSKSHLALMDAADAGELFLTNLLARRLT